jgi:hypothetical protein
MSRTGQRKTLILLVATMMLTPALSLALPVGNGDAQVNDGEPGPVGAGVGKEPMAIDVDIYADRFTPLMPWPTNRTFYDMVWISDYGLMSGSGGTLLKYNATAIEWIHTGTEESLYDIAYSWPNALIVGNHSSLYVWNVVTEDLTKIDVSYDQRFLGVTWDGNNDKAVIVGNGGFIGIFNGTEVVALSTGLIDFIYRIEWIPGGDHAVAVGDGGLLVKVNTTEVINSTRLNLNWGLWRLGWDSEGDYAIIAGKDYRFVPPRSLVLRYNATGTFDLIQVPGNLTSGLRSVSFGGGHAPEADRAVIAGENSTVLLWTGTGLSNLNAPFDRTLRTSIWYNTAAPEDELYVAGNRGVIMHYQGGSWNNVSFDPRMDHHSIEWRPQGDYGLVVGEGGFIAKTTFQGGTMISSPGSEDLFDVSWASDGTYALICGAGGKVLRYNHGATTTTSIGSGLMGLIDLYGVSVKPGTNDALAVGDGGHIWLYRSGVWTDQKPVTEHRNLRDVAWKPDGSYAVIVGVSGTVLKYETGTASNFQPTLFTYKPLFSLAWNKAGNKLMVVGDKDPQSDFDAIYVYDGDQWLDVESDTGAIFYGCAFTGDGEVGVAFGYKVNEVFVVKFSTRSGQGARSSFRSPYTDLRRGCMDPDGRGVYFVGSNGYAYHMTVGEFANSPPFAAIESPRTGGTFEIGERVELSANGSSDPDGDLLTYTWVSNVSGMIAQGKVMTVTFEDPGWHRIDLYVDDGKSHNISEFTIIKLVVPNYRPVPVINSPADGESYTNEDTIVFDGTGSYDPNGDNITYLWVSNRSGNIGDQERVESRLPVGSHQVFLWVTDPQGERVGEWVNITITQANRPPIVFITEPLDGQRYEPDAVVELNGSYSFDPDGDILSFEWVSDVEGTLGFDQVLFVTLTEGPHMISLTAYDGRGLSSTAVVNITVEPPEDRPPNLTLAEPPSNSTVSGVVTFSGLVSDPEGATVTVRYAVEMPNEWLNVIVDAGGWSFQWDTTVLNNGQYSIWIEASDGTNSPRLFTQYFVDNAPLENQPPTIVLLNPEPGNVKGRVVLEGVASDPDGDAIVKVEVRFDSGLWQPVMGSTAWTYQWETDKTPNGPVVVTVRAFDGEDYSEYGHYSFEVKNEATEPDTGTGVMLYALLLVVIVVLAVAGWFLYSRR